MTTPTDIQSMVIDYHRLKNDQRLLRGRMVDAAVALGVTQAEALKMDLPVFLDGWLFANGHKPARLTKESA